MYSTVLYNKTSTLFFGLQMLQSDNKSHRNDLYGWVCQNDNGKDKRFTEEKNYG